MPDATVLIVEDCEALADGYAAFLEGDHTVRTAYSGAAAMDRLDGTVDVVLIDRRLPDLSGADLLERISGADGHWTVAVLSGLEPDGDLAAGDVDAYLTKPIDGEGLNDLVDRLAGLEFTFS